MSQDPNVFANPDEFIPERYSDGPSRAKFQTTKYDVQFTFGFGRRYDATVNRLFLPFFPHEHIQNVSRKALRSSVLVYRHCLLAMGV